MFCWREAAIELLHIERVLLYPVSQKSASTKWRIYKGKIWTPDTSPSTHSIFTNSMEAASLPSALSIPVLLTTFVSIRTFIIIKMFTSCNIFTLRWHNRCLYATCERVLQANSWIKTVCKVHLERISKKTLDISR